MRNERILLDEARINSKKPNLKAKSFLLEVEGGQSYLERCKQDPNLPIFFTGIIQSGDKPNRNNRVYPWIYLKRECQRYLENEVRNGLAYSELDHPENSSTPSLKNAAGVIEDIWFDDIKKDVYARIKVLNAYAPSNDPALKVRNIILNNKNVGISSRALGSLKENSYGEHDVVDEDLEIICFDFVSNASNYGSERMQVTENVKYLTESQCFGDYCVKKDNKTIINLKEARMQELTEQEKIYLNILGVEKFLQVYRKFGK